MKIIKNNLKQIMDKMGMSQADLVRGTGLQKTIVSKLYRAEDIDRVSFRTILAVENYLGKPFYTIEDDSVVKAAIPSTFASTIAKCTTEKELVQAIKKFYKLKSKQPFRIVFRVGTPVRTIEELPLMISKGKIYSYYRDITTGQSIDLLHLKNNIHGIETNPYLYKVGDVVPVNNSGYQFNGVIEKIDPEMNVIFKRKHGRVLGHMSDIIDSYMLTRTLNDVPQVVNGMAVEIGNPNGLLFTITNNGNWLTYDSSKMCWVQGYDISDSIMENISEMSFNAPYIIPTAEQLKAYIMVKEEIK